MWTWPWHQVNVTRPLPLHICYSIAIRSNNLRMVFSIGTLGENNSTDYVEKIKVDTLFISNAENGVRVRTTKVNSSCPRFSL